MDWWIFLIRDVSMRTFTGKNVDVLAVCIILYPTFSSGVFEGILWVIDCKEPSQIQRPLPNIHYMLLPSFPMKYKHDFVRSM